jgi:hypothetical protein
LASQFVDLAEPCFDSSYGYIRGTVSGQPIDLAEHPFLGIQLTSTHLEVYIWRPTIRGTPILAATEHSLTGGQQSWTLGSSSGSLESLMQPTVGFWRALLRLAAYSHRACIWELSVSGKADLDLEERL